MFTFCFYHFIEADSGAIIRVHKISANSLPPTPSPYKFVHMINQSYFILRSRLLLGSVVIRTRRWNADIHINKIFDTYSLCGTNCYLGLRCGLCMQKQWDADLSALAVRGSIQDAAYQVSLDNGEFGEEEIELSAWALRTFASLVRVV